jgi:PIN domain nuclease of toxin-antitoxin system
LLLDTHALIWAVDDPAKLGPSAAQALADPANELLLSAEYADAAAKLPNHHGDPFDSLLIGQSRVANAPIASADAILDQYGISRVW